MRISSLLLGICFALGCVSSSTIDELERLDRRQGGTSNQNELPDLGSGSLTGSNASTASSSSSATVSSSASLSTSVTSIGSETASGTSPAPSQARSAASESSSASTLSATPTPGARNNQTHVAEGIPLDPGITPALSIGGVILILTGITYALIGVKNRWMHISLSTAYLTSLSVCVLIVYVMNPPVSNAIQGAYFVGIFMTGVIFGGGALIFKEVTEGLGCLLGGFCLAMWFLTLKSGGLVTNTTGKAIFITIFCVLAWTLSFSHITRPYALIGATSFSGATAFVLGIDCFSRGGLKEFWLYIWNLNPDLFPLNTNTYPITRGSRVETIVIVLGCIIGIISQLKIWKVIKDRQKKRANALQEDSRRQEAVEAALGRHLEMRNDRDKSEWERQYGNLLHAKRETILWSDAHRETKTYSRISEAEIGDALNTSSTDSLEMSSMSQPLRSVYVTREKRRSTLAVDTITEVDESGGIDQPSRYSRIQDGDHTPGTYATQSGSRTSLLYPTSPRPTLSQESLRSESKRQSRSFVPQAERNSTSNQEGSKRSSQLREYRTLKVGSRASFQLPGSDNYPTSNAEPGNEQTPAHAPTKAPRVVVTAGEIHNEAASQQYPHAQKPQRLSPALSGEGSGTQSLDNRETEVKKRRSWSSMFSKSSGKEKDSPSANASQEALMETLPVNHHSRASSVAATLDSENEIQDLNIDPNVSHATPPDMVVSTVQPPDSAVELLQRKTTNNVPVPPVLEEEFDVDPEELVRPYPSHSGDVVGTNGQSSSGPNASKARAVAESEVGTEILFDGHPLSNTGTTNTSFSEILTKGALDKVPNHLSNVVLSYRTNEWAKHASTADAPLYEEPEILEEEHAVEEPAHLASPEEAQQQATVVQPPPLLRPSAAVSRTSLHEAAISSPTEGVKVNPVAQSVQQPSQSTRSAQTIQPAPTALPIPTVPPQLPLSRTRVAPELGRNNSANRGLRSSSTPMLVPNLATTPIDENAAATFSPYGARQSASVLSINRLSGDSTYLLNRSSSGFFGGGPQPYGGVYQNVGAVQQPGSRLSLVSDVGVGPMRSASQISLSKPLAGGRSETRMASYDSHQPTRRNSNVESQRREAMFADWRLSQQKSSTQTDYSEAHHAQKIFERMQEKQMKESERTMKAQQEMQVDVTMRSRDMQDAHREAMRKMQAGVKKIT